MVIFLGLTMTWRSSQENNALPDDGAMRGLSGMFYEGFGTKDVVRKAIDDKMPAVHDVDKAYRIVVTDEAESGDATGG